MAFGCSPGKSERDVRPRGSALPALLTVTLLLWAGSPAPAAGGPGLPMAQARVLIAGETFTVDLADTAPLQARGLSGRAHLGPREGMLFLYAQRERHTFWMKDMLIPIDIIWLDNRRVVHIEHRVPPPVTGTPDWRLPTYRPDRPANLVLEVAAGRAGALGLRVGSEVGLAF